MNALLFKAASLFGVGFLTSLTPCVYPMIPITVGYLGSGTTENQTKKNKILKVLGFVSGQIATFTTLGLIAVYLGEVFGFSSEIPEVQIVTGIILILMAFFSFKGELPSFIQKWNNSSLMGKGQVKSWQGNPFMAFGQALLIGAVSALVASPCTGPVLGGVLAQVATEGSLFRGGLLMMTYSTGMSMIFLFLGLGLLSSAKLPKSGNWLAKVHKISSFLLLGAGVYFIGKPLGAW